MGDKNDLIVNYHRHLGIIMSNDLTCTAHIDELISKSYTRLTLLTKLKHTLDILWILCTSHLLDHY